METFTDRRTPPAFLDGMTEFGGETVVGFRAITTTAGTVPCTAGCMAPGSSPHSHTVVTGYQLITLVGMYEFDLDGNCVRATSIHSTVQP